MEDSIDQGYNPKEATHLVIDGLFQRAIVKIICIGSDSVTVQAPSGLVFSLDEKKLVKLV